MFSKESLQAQAPPWMDILSRFKRKEPSVCVPSALTKHNEAVCSDVDKPPRRERRRERRWEREEEQGRKGNKNGEIIRMYLE